MALLHDLCKANFYTEGTKTSGGRIYIENEFECGLVFDADDATILTEQLS